MRIACLGPFFIPCLEALPHSCGFFLTCFLGFEVCDQLSLQVWTECFWLTSIALVWPPASDASRKRLDTELSLTGSHSSPYNQGADSPDISILCNQMIFRQGALCFSYILKLCLQSLIVKHMSSCVSYSKPYNPFEICFKRRWQNFSSKVICSWVFSGN